METIQGMVDGTIYRNEENGYTVMSIRVGRSEQTVIGTLPELMNGEQVEFTGEWVEHAQYGRQLKVTGCRPIKPTTLLGIERYLGSGLIKGIGPSTAKKIVECFGEETLDILSEHPERLSEVPKLGKKRCQLIADSYREQIGVREAMIFLQSYGIQATLAVKISRLYGERTAAVIREDPYRLCEDLEGVGFQTADRIGMALGVSPDAPGRIRSALKYLLQEAAAGAGHVFLWRQELLNRAVQLLRVSEELVSNQLARMLLARDLTANHAEEDDRVYLPAFDSAEREVAQRLCELLVSAPGGSNRALTEAAIDRFEKTRGISFSVNQRAAIISAMEHGVLVITGGPGTGKTTIINCIISLMREENSVLLCAPTGRAAKRMTEATGVEAKTIHRLLEYSGDSSGFSRNQENPLETDCVICDETSMVDLMLMRSLLRAIEPGVRLILVGDADQLPSVGAGNVLGDILSSGVIPCARLTDIYRQSETSRIVTNAHLINHGQMPILNGKGTDFFFERQDYMQPAAQSIVKLATSRLPVYLKYPEDKRLQQAVSNIQVLAPARKGECGVIALNMLLQQAMNPPSPKKKTLTYGDTTFREGDKVMQMHNDYDQKWRKPVNGSWQDGQGVFNGDVGFITAIDDEDRSITVLFDEDREAVYEDQALENLDLAYCLSVHKSQGSEFPVVIMPVVGGPVMLLTRNLLYTAMTRARSLVVLVGREDVIRQMVENNHILHRNTTLAERLQTVPGMHMGEDV